MLNRKQVLRGLSAAAAASALPACAAPVTWTASRVKGTPEPPLPYRTRKVYDHVRFGAATSLAFAPGSGASEKSDAASASRTHGRASGSRRSAPMAEAAIAGAGGPSLPWYCGIGQRTLRSDN